MGSSYQQAMNKPAVRVILYAAFILSLLWSGAIAANQGLEDDTYADARLAVQLPRYRYLHLIDQYLYIMRMSLTGSLLQVPAVNSAVYNAETRRGGLDWPMYGYTMVGLLRLRHIITELVRLEERNVEGDFVECGVWRGGASVYAKAVVSSYHMQRRVILVDSFNGLPPNTTEADSHMWSEMDYLKVSLETVKDHFKLHRLLDGSVEFYKGYFNVSTPVLAEDIRKRAGTIAYLRMDGDMYESTMDQLFNLYEFVPVGGIVCVDDWQIPEARKAVNEFLQMHDATETFVEIDSSSVYWVKSVNFAIKREWYDAFNQKRFGNQ